MHGVNISKGRTITSLLLWLRRLSSNSSARRDGQGRIEKLSSLSRIGEEQESGNRAITRIRAENGRYLIQRIVENPGIELHHQTEIVALAGDSHLERVTWLNRATHEESVHDIRHVFVTAGASPRTDWLRGCLALEEQGFILTGRDLDPILPSAPVKWPLSRPPQMLETSLPAVFAVGDIRSGNVKRVASAVGEGSISIHLVHRALVEM
jgi:thioredoxin reductase (NADPH)